ncbi:MAG: photosystem I assembly BtpA [Desulfurococcales archaeon ex4484_58]|nr:MAG: photosystem I assembly BtpA [Desulfurococcales archaeon ex4484_58]
MKLKLIGMIHLPPLPGSPGYLGLNLSINDYIEYALGEADKLYRAGFDGLIIENYMDYPYSVKVDNTEVYNILGKIVESVKKEYSSMLIGLNILRNSGVEAADLICRFGGDFIRVNAYLEPVLVPEGFLEPIARLIWDRLLELECKIKIYADVNVKHSKPLIPYVDALYNTCSRGLIDGVIVTGKTTGEPPNPSDVYIAKTICKDRDVWVGSGISIENIGLYIGYIDGVVIGTNIKEQRITSNPIKYEYAKNFVDRVNILMKRLNRQKLLR